MDGILTSLLSLITGGLTTMATNMGAGIKAFIEGLFINVPASGDPTLTTFGSLIAIFAGISLAFGICRWVCFLVNMSKKSNWLKKSDLSPIFFWNT